MHLVSTSGNGRDFGVKFKPNITDVSIFGYYLGRPRPGFKLDTYLSFDNLGTLTASGQASVKLDPLYHFESADPAPTAVIGTDSLVWDFSQIPLFEHQTIRINGKVDSSAMLGNVLRMRGHITPSLADFAPDNNHFIRIDTIVGSYDPNEKQVEPARGLTATEIAAGKELTYTVLFQNTGNLPAEKVRITDHLDTALNISTLRLVASSHPISSFRLLPGNLLEVIFENIALPDSNSNEPGSHGFVRFAIQRNKAYYASYTIANRAAIYFDYNEPVITNTVSTPLASPSVATEEPWKALVNTPALEISPNPTAQFCTVKTRGLLSGAGEIAILNASNQVCYRQSVPQLADPIQVRAQNLPDGTYWVRASGSEGQMLGKLIIIH
jgi:uncharacterized repeat protein (TIGR01451 family)